MNIYVPRLNDTGTLEDKHEDHNLVFMDMQNCIDQIDTDEHVGLTWFRKRSVVHQEKFVHIAEYRVSLAGKRKLKYSVIELNEDGSRGRKRVKFIQSNNIRRMIRGGRTVETVNAKEEN